MDSPPCCLPACHWIEIYLDRTGCYAEQRSADEKRKEPGRTLAAMRAPGPKGEQAQMNDQANWLMTSLSDVHRSAISRHSADGLDRISSKMIQ